MLKIQTKQLLMGALAAACGTTAVGESGGFCVAGAAWNKRLYLKAAESFIDAATRAIIGAAAAPAAREEYHLSGEVCEYEDHVWGLYQGNLMPHRYRRMWVDPVNGQPHYETSLDQVIQDRYPFYYATHNRAYRCVGTGPQAGLFDYNITARVVYALRNTVTRPDAANGVWSHPVRADFGMRTLPGDCANSSAPVDVVEIGFETLPRGGAIRKTPHLTNADVSYCLVMYDQK